MRRGLAAVLSLAIAGFASGASVPSAYAAALGRVAVSGPGSVISGQAGASLQSASSLSLAPQSVSLSLAPLGASLNVAIPKVSVVPAGQGSASVSPTNQPAVIHQAVAPGAISKESAARGSAEVRGSAMAVAPAGTKAAPTASLNLSGASYRDVSADADSAGRDSTKKREIGARAGLQSMAGRSKSPGPLSFNADFDGEVARARSDFSSSFVSAGESFISRPSGLSHSVEPTAERLLGFGSLRFGQPGFERTPPVLEGERPLKDYKPSKELNRNRAFLLAAHGLLLAGAAGMLVLSFGVLPVGLAAAVVSADLSWQYGLLSKDDGARAFGNRMWGEERRSYEAYLKDSLAGLIRRLGLPAEKTPGLTVTNISGAAMASVKGRGFGSDARLTVGEGFAYEPAEATTAVLAHELGHIVHKDYGTLRLLRTRSGLTAGMGFVLKTFLFSAGAWTAVALFGAPVVAFAVIAGLMAAAALLQSPAIAGRFAAFRQAQWTRSADFVKSFKSRYGWTFPSFEQLAAAAVVVSAFALQGIAEPGAVDAFSYAVVTALAAFPLAFAGFLAGIAVSRVEERRADHFAAWLTEPEWLAAYFEGRAKSAGPRYDPLGMDVYWSLMSTHPTDGSRAERLRR